MNRVERNASFHRARLLLLIALPVAGAALPIIMAGCPSTARQVVNNIPPEAKISADQSVDAGTLVTLDGGGSADPDGGTLEFSWKQLFGAPVSLSASNAAVVTFTAPTIGTALLFELTVSDGGLSSAAQTRVSVKPRFEGVELTELRQPSIQDDPAVTGKFPAGFTIAQLPEGPREEDGGAPSWIDDAKYAPVAELDLAPGETHEIGLDLSGAAALMATARWIGTSELLAVTVSLDGSVLDTGSGYSIGSERGGSTLKVDTTTGGRATLTVTNTSSVSVQIRMVLGAFAL